MLRLRIAACAVFALSLSCSTAPSDPGFDSYGGYGGTGTWTTTTTTTTTTTGTTTTTTTGTTTTTTSTTTTTTGSGGAGGACLDVGHGEYNDTETTAWILGTIDDCDGSGSSRDGVLDGPNDVDWYVFHGDDSLGCVVDPAVEVTSDGVGGARVCIFLQCSNGLGSTQVAGCPSGTTSATSPDGRPGCCGDDGLSIAQFDLSNANCTGTTDDNMDVYLRVDDPFATCATYRIDYHF